MKENKNWRKMLSSGMQSKLAELTEMGKEDIELYLFIRGGFGAK